VLKKFTLLFLRLKLPFVPVCSGIPTLKFILPLNPNRSCFFRIIFKIPAVPSASYLADGDVTTSTCWIDSDGIDLRPSGPDNPTRPDGFPFINILLRIYLLKFCANFNELGVPISMNKQLVK